VIFNLETLLENSILTNALPYIKIFPRTWGVMRKKELTQQQRLCLAFEYRDIKEKYEKNLRRLKLFNKLFISTLVLGGICLPIIGLQWAFVFTVLGMTATTPVIYLSRDNMKLLFESINKFNMKHKQFKKLHESGEIEKWVEELKKPQLLEQMFAISDKHLQEQQKSAQAYQNQSTIVRSQEKTL